MKSTKIIYWVTTILFAGFMIFSSIGDIIMQPEAVKFILSLGYPEYFIPFIGWAKILGCIGVLVPGFNRLKEWAYAGLFFDLCGALYSTTAKFGFDAFGFVFITVVVAVGATSYIMHHKLRKAKGQTM